MDYSCAVNKQKYLRAFFQCYKGIQVGVKFLKEMAREKRERERERERMVFTPIAHVINCDAIIDRPLLHLDSCPDISCMDMNVCVYVCVCVCVR